MKTVSVDTTRSTPEQPWLVDTNLHVIARPHEREQYPLDPLPGTAGEFTEEQSVTVTDVLHAMDDAGVHQAVVIASRFHGFDNRYCLDSVAQHPERTVAVANINVFAPDVDEQVATWVQQGARGLRFWGGGRGVATWIDRPDLRGVWELVRALGVPMNAQTTTPAAFAATRRFLDRFGDMRLVINNLGHVPLAAGARSAEATALFELSAFPNVYVTFSTELAVAIRRGDRGASEVFEGLCEHFGPSRLCWSAFFPSEQRRPYRESVRILQDVLGGLLDHREQAWVLGGAARALYPTLQAVQPTSRS